jgi:uncharacterized flavoprotein (TIGR03862 family)
LEVSTEHRQVVNSASSALDVQSGRGRVLVVGAGPAGLMAAETVASAGHNVTVIEQMPSAGRKLLMAGRGGLNLTHSEPLETFLDRYGTAREVLEPTIRAFPPEALVAWAQALGQETLVGTSGRIFPRAMKASPLLRAWLGRLSGLGVELRLRHRLIELSPAGGVIVADAEGGRMEIRADAVILALGGASWPRLGSDGHWTALVEEMGIGIVPLEAANSGVAIRWSSTLVERHAGAPLKRIAVSCGDVTSRGEAIVTSAGLEGGAIYALSTAVRDALRLHGTASLLIDLRPDISAEALSGRLASARKGDTQTNILRKAARLSPAGVAVLREGVANRLPSEPTALASLIKAVPLVVTGLGAIETAISTAGGISWREIDINFMLKKRPGIFCAGEMVDWEAPTGGYLLQACFATGKAAGHGALAHLADVVRSDPAHR